MKKLALLVIIMCSAANIASATDDTTQQQKPLPDKPATHSKKFSNKKGQPKTDKKPCNHTGCVVTL